MNARRIEYHERIGGRRRVILKLVERDCLQIESSARHEPEKQGLLGNRLYFCFEGSHLDLT